MEAKNRKLEKGREYRGMKGNLKIQMKEGEKNGTLNANEEMNGNYNNSDEQSSNSNNNNLILNHYNTNAATTTTTTPSFVRFDNDNNNNNNNSNNNVNVINNPHDRMRKMLGLRKNEYNNMNSNIISNNTNTTNSTNINNNNNDNDNNNNVIPSTIEINNNNEVVMKRSTYTKARNSINRLKYKEENKNKLNVNTSIKFQAGINKIMKIAKDNANARYGNANNEQRSEWKFTSFLFVCKKVCGCVYVCL